MVLNIRISPEQILSQDTSAIRRELDGLIESSSMIKKHENDIALIFQGLTTFDILKKLKLDEYRSWFKKLDSEIPGLPYFLNEPSNSLLFFIMGNVAYEEKDSSAQFDNIEASRFFREKTIQMRNLCLPHNINPQPSITRIAGIISGDRKKTENHSGESNVGDQSDKTQNSSENEKKKGAIKDFLDKYGSIAFLNNDRTVKLTLVINEIPSRISFIKNFLVKDPSLPQQFFLTVLKTDTGISEIKSLILANITDVEPSIEHNKGVYIQVVTKSEDGSYQMLFESGSIFAITVTNSLKEDLEKIALDTGTSFSTEEIQPVETKHPEKTEEVSQNDEPEKQQEPYSLSSAVITLRKENEALHAKVAKLEKLIEVYEDEINKKRSIKGFFGKFFS